uniref:Leucine-rich repeat-containing protein 20 isoform X6 n=1 Tax=Geotrypetes seraphini TaxID=260995 RepID=A0A6P8QF79_GEOSA|nr:leucine-rich repeat-containing protein 20 isoform X6 [Geotrypetes seraphini]
MPFRDCLGLGLFWKHWCGACMHKKMAEAVARVARKVNETVENKEDHLELNLAGNCLHQLPEEAANLQHLKVIYLSRNNFQEFPKQLVDVSTLETIDLEKNQISDIPMDKLASMKALQSVNLKSNPLNSDRLAAYSPHKFQLLTSDKEVPTAAQT